MCVCVSVNVSDGVCECWHVCVSVSAGARVCVVSCLFKNRCEHHSLCVVFQGIFFVYLF